MSIFNIGRKIKPTAREIAAAAALRATEVQLACEIQGKVDAGFSDVCNTTFHNMTKSNFTRDEAKILFKEAFNKGAEWLGNKYGPKLAEQEAEMNRLMGR